MIYPFFQTSFFLEQLYGHRVSNPTKKIPDFIRKFSYDIYRELIIPKYKNYPKLDRFAIDLDYLLKSGDYSPKLSKNPIINL